MQRPLLLTGFMATGKSTVGRVVAERSRARFLDLDAEIERIAGSSVADIFALHGEAGFRALERDALRRVLDSGDPVVVALGGGALLARETRLDAVDRGVVVALTASPDEVLRRAAQSGPRPLLNVSDPKARVTALSEERKLAYAECHGQVETTARTPEDVATDVLGIWRRNPLAVAAGENSYAVDIGHGIAAERLPLLVAKASLALLVTDENVRGHHAASIEKSIESAGVRSAAVVLTPGEEHKDVASLERIWQGALAARADRKSVVVALGGGVVTDVAGFAASTWMRGVPWVGLPTTLLAMVDASVGGKTAIDLKNAKNAVGAFWQPRAVLCDVHHLSTEPERGYRSALAEVIKTAIIGDAPLFGYVERHAKEILGKDPAVVTEVVRRCIQVKARVVSQDERESGVRATLNLGHTVGHALEAHDGYGNLRHGEAVSLGLVAALRIGERLGITDGGLTERCIGLLGALGLPVDLTAQPLAEALDLIGNDKKRAGSKLRFVAARSLGSVDLIDLDVEELRRHALSLAG